MEGLFFYHDSDGITYLNFYPDGRIISYGKYTKLNQPLQTFPGYRIETDNVHYSRGFYQLDFGGGINIYLKGRFGKMVYRGTIQDENTIDLSYSCPFTNFRKSATFLRYSPGEHIIHFEISDTYAN